MAESVARVRILAQVEGLEGFDKLKSAFRGLQQAIGPADSELNKARKQILEFGKAGAQTEQVLKGQVEALKALQAQATIGGTVYRKLGQDVKALGGAYKEAATGVKQFSDAQLKSQIVGSKPETFDPQIAALRKSLQKLKVYGREYTDVLTDIQRRQLPFNAALGRQNVIAGFEAYQQGGKGGSALPELPNTSAALQQRMGELNAELVNLSRGGTDWIRVSREIANVQRQLNQEFANPAVEIARRRLEASRNTSSGFLAFSTGLEDRLAIQGSIQRNQRKREREAAARSGAMQGPPAPSELFQGIAGIGNQAAANQVQLMGRSYNEVAASIRRATAASDGSINSLQAQRQSWEALRNTLGNNKVALREVGKEIAAVDRQLEKRGAGGRRGGAAQIGQGAGALAASGIFGGPEGFLGSAGGAAIGALVGGPAGFATGAFLGGSAGAYAGMGRQALGGMSTYAADIQKQEIALKGITKTQEEYSRALAASAAVTRDFNVPQLEATRGMTQLSAAVIGAGGNVNDAEVVFRNVTAAIKASGGSSEDVQGSLTALAQIFSKGKVSAEELQGQLGERLPGAVTMFAKATGRTLPQLQKDLEQGVVGLADLMKFVSSDQGLGQFEQRAKTVAQSSAEAGARMTVAFNETKRAIGEALLPLGAELQGAFADFLRDSTPALVKIAEGFVGVARATGTVTKAFMDFTAPLREFFAGSIFAYLRSAKAFWGSLKNDLDSFWGRVGDFLGSIGKAFTGFFDDLKSLGTRALRAVGVDTEWLGKTMDGVVTQLKKVWDSFFDFVKRRWKQTVSNMINYSNPLFFLLKKAGIADVGGAAAKGLEAGMTFPEEPGGAGGKKDKPPAPGQLTDWQQQQQQAKDKAAKDAKQLEDDRRRLAEQTAQAQKQLADAVFRYQQELDRKRYELQVELANQLRQNYVDSLVGPRKEVANEFTQLMRDLEQFGRRQAEIAQRIAAARQEIATSKTVASVVGQGASMPATGGNAIFGSTGNVKNAPGWVHGHLQSFGTSAELISQATAMVQRLLSQGVKVYINGVGDLRSNMSEKEIRAAVEAGRRAHTHSGDGRSLDIFVPQGTKVPMPLSGVRSMGSRGGIGGMIDGSNVAVMHLDPASRAGGGKGAIAEAKAVSNVAMEEANLNSLLKEQAQLQQKAGDMIKARIEGYQINRIAPIEQETYQLREQVAALADRNQLELAGVRPEVLDGEMQKAALRRKESEQLAQLNSDLEAAEKLKDPTVAEGFRKSIVDQTTAYQDQRNAIDELTKAQIAFNDAMRFRQDDRIGEGLREGVQGYVESIGTMREATAQLAQDGIKGLEDQIYSLVTTGTANFRQFAADILRQTARMIIQQLVLRTIFKGLGFLGGGGGGFFANGGVFGGGISFNPAADSMPSLMNANGNAFAKNNVIPFAQGGIVNKPTLFKFANGGTMRTGVMGEAGPEAIVPLKRGPDGKLGISGGGGGNVTVNVSVDASGSKVQGDSSKGEQLGRAVSQAVQEELLRQKRPGGLLAA